MFQDVIEARELRATLQSTPREEGLEAFYRRGSITCPVTTCRRPLRDHRDTLPCQRRNEFDRHGFQR